MYFPYLPFCFGKIASYNDVFSTDQRVPPVPKVTARIFLHHFADGNPQVLDPSFRGSVFIYTVPTPFLYCVNTTLSGHAILVTLYYLYIYIYLYMYIYIHMYVYIYDIWIYIYIFICLYIDRYVFAPFVCPYLCYLHYVLLSFPRFGWFRCF